MNSLEYNFPANILLKSDSENNERIKIEIIPNTPHVDRVKDKILLKAYDEECISNFLNVGIIDFDHISFLGKTPFEKSQAIIGEPEDFYIDKERMVPVCNAVLFKSNPYVSQSIYPALKAGSKKISASLGGKILRKSSEYDAKLKSEINVISKLSLQHIAVTPRYKAINTEASVSLRKSCTGNGTCKTENKKCIDCNKSYILDFDTYEYFLKSLEDYTLMFKTLEAGSSTDISNMIGAQNIQSQSLEGNKKQKIDNAKIKHSLPFIIEKMIKGEQINIDYLKSLNFNEKEIVKIIQLLADSKNLVKLTF